MSLTPHDPTTPTVLVVDDEAELREAIVEILVGEGIVGIDASSGPQALQILKEREVDLILLDLMMPGMDGREFVEALRNRGDETPVVLVSASRDLRRVARELGLEGLTKPFDLEDLVRVVQEGLEASAALRRAAREAAGSP